MQRSRFPTEPGAWLGGRGARQRLNPLSHPGALFPILGPSVPFRKMKEKKTRLLEIYSVPGIVQSPLTCISNHEHLTETPGKEIFLALFHRTGEVPAYQVLWPLLEARGKPRAAWLQDPPAPSGSSGPDPRVCVKGTPRH